MSLAAIAAALFFLPESHGPEQRAAHEAHHSGQPSQSLYAMLREHGNRLLVMQFTVHTACVTSVSYLFPLWVGDLLGWGAREVGITFGVQGLMMAAIQGGLVGPLSKWMGELPFMRTGIAIMLVGFVIAIFSASEIWMVASFLVALLGAAFTMPILNSLATQRTPPMLRGRMMGTTASAGSWGRVVGPLLTGGGLYFFNYPVAWLLATLLAIWLLLWALLLAPDVPREGH